jgi:hypothetical protein
MSLLKRTEEGVINHPLFAVIYGEPGCGKSTFGSQFPNPYFIDIEKGSRQLNVKRFFPNDFNEVIQVSKELLESSYETIVYDSMDALESMVWKQTCLDNNWITIEDPGYGKGPTVALKKWEQLMDIWDRLRQSKNVFLICHTEAKTINDPTQTNPYDKFQIKINKHPAGLIRSRVDMILFAQKEQITKTEKGQKKAKVVGEERWLFTKGGPGFEGKNRYRMPDKMPLSFQDFWDSYQKGINETPNKIISEIKVLLPFIEKEKVDQINQFVEKHKTNLDQLVLALSRAIDLAKPKMEDK